MTDKRRPPRERRGSGSDRRTNRNAWTDCIAVLRLFLLLVLAIARPIRGYRQYESLNRRERRSHDAARQVIAYERDYGGGIYHAIRDLRTKGVRVSIRSVKGYFPKAVTYDWRGRLVASESDPYLRVMKILTTDGLRDVYVRGSHNASNVAGHEAAVRNALLGNEEPLHEWRASYGDRMFVGRDGRVYAPETDPDVITEREERGELDFEDIYPDVT